MVPYALETYGVPYLHIHRADYHRILVEEAGCLGVDMQLDSTVTKIDFEKPCVCLKNKPEFQADVIIGADGLKSVCRESLLGCSDPPHLTGDLAYRIIVKAEDMKRHPQLRDLAEKPAINYWMGPDGHAVCYLLQGGGLYNIVLICPDNLPELVNTAKADLKEMLDFFENWDPKLKALLGLVQETSKWRLQNSVEMQTWGHPGGKFVLLGDACHATLPYLLVSLLPISTPFGNDPNLLIKNYSAQGAAQAVEDGAVLGTLFSRLTSRSQVSTVLSLFEQLRKSRTTRVVEGSTDLRNIFHMHDGEEQRERDRQLLEERPFEGFPNRWADPVFQKWLFGYDVEKEVEMAWEKVGAGAARANL